MKDLTGPIARIVLRYGVGGAVGAELATDPDAVLMVAGAVGLAVEGAYWAARRLGWRL